MQEEPTPNRKDTFNMFLNDMGGMAQELTTNIRASFSKALEQGIRYSKFVPFPLVDAYETTDSVIIVTSPLVGLVVGSLDVSMSNNVLTIKGETKPTHPEPEGVCFRREHTYGSFSREVEIPFTVKSGEARAKLQDHILTITLPKAIHTTPQNIPVNM